MLPGEKKRKKKERGIYRGIKRRLKGKPCREEKLTQTWFLKISQKPLELSQKK